MSGFDWSKAPNWATAVGKYKGSGGSYAWLCDEGYCFQGILNPACHPYKDYKREGFVIVAHRHAPAVITLTAAEVSSGYDRVKWAEGLIRQLPVDHEGRNSWLMNYGDPVQREADEREQACRQMCIDAGMDADHMAIHLPVAYKIYDNGWRKP